MEKVAQTLYMVRRGEVWHYFRRVPVHLVPLLGKKFVKQSLGVKDLKAAKRLRNALNIKVDADFAAAERALNAPDIEFPTETVTLSALTEYLRNHIAGLDDRDAARLTSDPPENEGERAEMKMDTEVGLQILKNRDDPRGIQWIDATSDKFLASSGAILNDREIVTQFAEIVRRGLIELQHRKLDRLNDAYDKGYYDPLFDPSRSPTVTFKELADLFCKERLEHYKINNRSEKWKDKVLAMLEFLREVIGDDTPVRSIDDDTVQHLRGILSCLPANRKKHYPKLSISDAIDRGEKEGKRILAPVTQGRYLDCLRDVLDVGVRKKFLLTNPSSKAKPIKKEVISPDQKRLPWTNDQIIGFFTGSFYRSCAPEAQEPYTKPDKEWRFWLPLIMLFTGARPNEITQLLIDDVKKTTAGNWYLDVIDSENAEEGKTTKNGYSRRRIPLHPEIIMLGFLKFVETRRKSVKKGNKRLFYEISPDKYGNTATYPTKRLREDFIPEEITLGERQVLYSLRHNVRDALRRVQAPPETLQAVTGWSAGGKTVSDSYGDPGDPDLHSKWVEKIAYPGLDLSFLHR